MSIESDKGLNEIIKIGLAGYGIVGKATVKTIIDNREIIKNNTGIDIIIKSVFSRNIDKIKDDKYLEHIEVKSKDIDVLIDDPEIDIIVELIGGVTLAKDIIFKAISKSKRVVTANKALLANYGESLFKSHLDIGFEASVAGSIPIIKIMKESLAANKIENISAILNGTCNYILTRMSKEEADFLDILKDAQDKGYAEADPTFDIEGIDTAHKICILSSIAFSTFVPLDKIFVNGISNILLIDVSIASGFGYTIKLLAEASRSEDNESNIEISVFPTMLKNTYMLSNVDYSFNALNIKGDIIGESMYYGSGAGGRETSGSVISDIITIARDMSTGDYLRVPLLGYVKNDDSVKIKDIKEVSSKFYIRFTSKNGTLSYITSVLEKEYVKITDAILKNDGANNYLIFITDKAPFGYILNALDKIYESNICTGKAFIMKIKD